MVVDIGLDVGVNVGQGTSTCGRPIREQKNTRCKWEVRSREPFSPSPPHLPLFHNTISPEEFRGNARLENLGRDSLQRSFSPRQHLDYKTKSPSPFWEEEEGSIIRLDGGGGTMQFSSTVLRRDRRRACFSNRVLLSCAPNLSPKSVNYRVRLEWRIQ